jgi:CSLREA domain-containing protein
MFLPSLRDKLLSRWGLPRAVELPRRQRPPRLRVEALEERCLPALITVTTLADELTPNDGSVSLREAVNAINNPTMITDADITGQNPGSFGNNDTIVFQAGLTDSMHPIKLSLGQISISRGLTIQGLGEANTIIDAQQQSRIFDITPTVLDVTLDGLTLEHGRTAGNNQSGAHTNDGGAIYCDNFGGTLTISNCTLSGNSTAGLNADGGAIFTDASAVRVINSILTGNSTTGANAHGGGISSSYGAVTLTNSTISGNFTQGNGALGGGIYASRFSRFVSLTGSTVSRNFTRGLRAAGGGIASYAGELTVRNSTVAGNYTTGDGSFGGGILANEGTPTPPVTVTNSTVSGNFTQGANAGGGGIASFESEVTVNNSTLAGNYTTATGSMGGGIFAKGYGDEFVRLTVTNCTLSGNFTQGAEANGGGIASYNSLVTLNNSTLTANSAPGQPANGTSQTGDGGGIYARVSQGYEGSFPVTVTSSIVAGNSDSCGNPDLAPASSTFTVTNSLIGNGQGTGLTPGANGNLIGSAANPIDPRLGPLQNIGGPTLTRALLPGSPAIDRGANPTAAPTPSTSPPISAASPSPGPSAPGRTWGHSRSSPSSWS